MSQGDTKEEAIEEIKEAILFYIETTEELGLNKEEDDYT
jgi:predicted RNase H-like HicB family nuclease